MLWTAARIIDHNRLVLVRVLAGLFVMAGIQPGTENVTTLPRSVKSAILLLLRPAESAARRLIFAKARALEMIEYVARPARVRSKGTGKKTGVTRIPQFRLIDPRKFFAALYPNRKPRGIRRTKSTEPRLLFRFDSFDGSPAVEAWSEPTPEASPDDPMNAVPLCRRMQALHHALEDLPKQAKRMAREIAKRAAASVGPKRVPPLRPGYAPGYRKRHIHEVDAILHDCHWLATREPEPPERRPAIPAV